MTAAAKPRAATPENVAKLLQRRPKPAGPPPELVRCAGCGVLCRRIGPLWDGQLFDINPQTVPWSFMPAWVIEAWLTQGIGIGWGRSHRCPPTKATMSPAVGSDGDLIGGVD